MREVVNAIEEPVNRFIDLAGVIDEQTAWANLQTEEDVVTYLTNNIVVDGLTLNDMFGETIA